MALLPYCFQIHITIAARLCLNKLRGFAILLTASDHIAIVAKLGRSINKALPFFLTASRTISRMPRSSAEAKQGSLCLLLPEPHRERREALRKHTARRRHTAYCFQNHIVIAAKPCKSRPKALPFCLTTFGTTIIALGVKLFGSMLQGFAIMTYGLLDHITIAAKLCRSMIQSSVILPYCFQNRVATLRSSAEACTKA